jgi:hypothetical protein
VIGFGGLLLRFCFYLTRINTEAREIMEQDDQQPKTSEPTPFERFEAMMKKVLAVPADEAKRIVRAVPSPVTPKKKRRRKSD